METPSPQARDGRATGGRIRRALPAGRASAALANTPRVPRARRGDPRPVPRLGHDGADRPRQRAATSCLHRLGRSRSDSSSTLSGSAITASCARSAAGGMGIVYEAEQVSLGRHVALKVLPQQLRPNSQAEAAVRAGGASGGPAAPHQHRAGLRHRRGGRAALLRDAVHPGAGAGPGARRAEAPAPGEADRGLGSDGRGPSWFRRRQCRLRRWRGRLLTVGRSSWPSRRSRAAVGWRGGRAARSPPRTEAPATSGRRRPAAVRGPRWSCRARAATGGDRRCGPTGTAWRTSGRRWPRPGVCPPAGGAAPRHQAGQPAPGHPGQRLGHRLRPGQVRRSAGPDATPATWWARCATWRRRCSTARPMRGARSTRWG